MGTVGYMSPEQVLGKPLDARSDLFSLGAVLYEMLSGKRPFQKETAPETMAAILKEEPPGLSGTSKAVSPGLDRIVRHCLEKEPEQRFQSARDVAFDLQSAGDFSSAEARAALAAEGTRARRLVGASALLAAGFAIGALAVWLTRAPAREPVRVRPLTFSGQDGEPSASPDGRLVAFTSTREGVSRIWVKQLGGGEAPLTAGPDRRPRFSPDGSSVLFVRGEGSRLAAYRASLVGSEPRKILDDVSEADWSPDGRRIAFLRSRVVSSQTESDPGRGRGSGRPRDGLSHGPRLLAHPRAVVSGRPHDRGHQDGRGRLRAGRRDPPRRSVERQGPGARAGAAESPGLRSRVVGAGSGHRVRAAGQRDGRQLRRARACHLEEHRVGQGAHALLGLESLPDNRRLEDVRLFRPAWPGPPRFRRDGARHQPAGNSDRPGSLRAAIACYTAGSGRNRQPTYSPDGEQLIFSSNLSGNLDLWAISTRTGALRQLTDDPAQDWDPAFTPDGKHILWSSDRRGNLEIWIANTDGSGARQLSRDDGDAENPTATPDGTWIVYGSGGPAKQGIWKIRPDGSGATRLVPGFLSNAEVSPDGRIATFVRLDRSQSSTTVGAVEIATGRLLPFEIRVPQSWGPTPPAS